MENNIQPAVSEKSMGVAYALWFFFGLLGVHHFYLNRNILGSVKLALTILAIIGIIIGSVLAAVPIVDRAEGFPIQNVESGDERGNCFFEFSFDMCPASFQSQYPDWEPLELGSFAPAIALGIIGGLLGIAALIWQLVDLVLTSVLVNSYNARVALFNQRSQSDQT